MDDRDFIGAILTLLKPAIDKRARARGYDDLFGEVGLAWSKKLAMGRIDRATAIPLTWGIVHNKLAEFCRRAKYRCHALQSENSPSSRELDPLDALLQSEYQRAVNAAFSDLPPEYQEVIRHRHVLGQRLAARARSAGTSPNTERTHYHRAILQMRKHRSVVPLRDI